MLGIRSNDNVPGPGSGSVTQGHREKRVQKSCKIITAKMDCPSDDDKAVNNLRLL